MPPPEPAVEPDLTDTVLGRYRLLRRLGVGGMGSVYLAQHELIDRQVAIKVLHPSLAQSPIARKRFLREARAASKVKHPGVVEIHDVAFAGNHVFFVMDLLAGHDLAARLDADGRLPWPRAFPILHQVAAAIAAAHAVGVIHRDIKPANCFLVVDAEGRERVKVVDFGIAKVTADDRSVTDELTATGEVFGTLGYMPPEMAQGAGDDPRSDIYALGVMMFRVLTGRLPFTGTALQVLSQHLAKPPPSPRSLEPSIPPDVEHIILRALEKEPDDRYPSMRALVAALESASTVAPARAPASRRAPVGSSPSPSRPLPVHDVVDLDQRAGAPRPTNATTDDPWRDPHAKTTAYGEEPPPPPMPDEPSLPPSLFRPPADPVLELELVQRPQPPQAPSPPAWRRLAPAILLVAALAAGGIAAWSHRDTITEAVPALSLEPSADDPSPVAPEPVLLRIETVPPNARISIDGVPATERPVAVPRSEQHVRVRVEAEGYEPRTIQVQPLRDRDLEVKLDRTKRRR